MFKCYTDWRVTWDFIPKIGDVKHVSNAEQITKRYYSALQINNVTKRNAGFYICNTDRINLTRTILGPVSIITDSRLHDEGPYTGKLDVQGI